MRVVVTGAAGFIGSRLARALLAQEHEVVGVDRLGADRLTLAWSQLSSLAGFRGVAADLAHLPLGELLEGADAVVHLAGRPGLSATRAEYQRDNVEVTARLGAACVAAGVGRFVHGSSSSVYGRHAVGDESTPLRPVSSYGRSKLDAEELLWGLHATHGLPVLALRFFSVYGPAQRPDMGVHRAICSALTGRPFPLHGDGSQTRSMTFVDDVVGAVSSALRHGELGRAYNIGGGVVHALSEVLEEVERQVGAAVPVVRVPAPPGLQHRTEADTRAATRDLGYRPAKALVEGLAHQVDWQLGRLSAGEALEVAG